VTTLATLVVRLTADAKGFHSEMGRAEKRTGGLLRGIGSKVQTVGNVALAGFGVMAGGAVLAGKALYSLAMDAAKFQDQLVGLELAASASGLSFQVLHDAALAVGGDTRLLGVSATGAADAMTNLYKAGLTTEEIFGDLNAYLEDGAELSGALRASIDLAAASELDMAQAADLAATLMATYGGSLETAEERAEFVTFAMNNMVQAADASVASVTDLSQALVNVGPTAGALGISLEDTNNALAILSTRGIKGAEAGTALKSMLVNMQRPTDEVTQALRDLNVSLYDSEGVFVGLPNLIAQLETAMAGMTDEQRNYYTQLLAGTYGMNALNTLLDEGTEGWDAMAAATADAATIQEQAARRAATFSGRMEALKGTLETLGIKIGEAVLPAITGLLDSFAAAVDTYGPQVVDFIEKNLVPILDTASFFIESFTAAILAGQSPIDALTGALRDIGLDELADLIEGVVRGIGDLWAAVGPFVEEVLEWVGSHVKLEDILLALGIAIGSVVIPALGSLISAAAPVVGVFLGLVGLFTLLRSAWVEDWGGVRSWIEEIWNQIVPLFQEGGAQIWAKLMELKPIWDELSAGGQGLIDWLVTNWPTIQQTISDVMAIVADVLVQIVDVYLTQFIEGVGIVVDWIVTNWPMIRDTAVEVFNTVVSVLQTVWAFIQENVVPVLATLWAWLAVNVPAAIAALSEFWNTVLLPVLQMVWEFIQTAIIPIFERAAMVAQEILGVAITTLATLWETILKPALEMVWTFIQDNVVPLFEALATLTEATVGKAVEVLAGLWETVLQPAIEAVHNFIDENLIPIFEKIVEVIEATVEPALNTLAETVLPAIEGAFEAVGKAVQGVIDFVNDLADKISNMELPDWLEPGSPPPLFYALQDIGKAMDMLSSRRLPAFAMGLEAIDAQGEGMVDVSAGVMRSVTRVSGYGSQSAGVGGQSIVFYGPVHVHGVQDPQSLVEALQELAG
jgi:TP901 family phage tail tape measure protein